MLNLSEQADTFGIRLFDAQAEREAQDADYSPVPVEYLNTAWIDISRECQEAEGIAY